MSLTIIPHDECERINEIIDYILVHTESKYTVSYIKEKFELSDEEYEMISVLMLPAMRWYNANSRTKIALRQEIKLRDRERERSRDILGT